MAPLGTGVEDDEQHANGTGHTLHREVVGELAPHLDLADGVFQATNVQDALEHVVELALPPKVQPRHQGVAEGAIGGRFPGKLQVLGIGREDVVLGLEEGVVNGLESCVAVLD